MLSVWHFCRTVMTQAKRNFPSFYSMSKERLREKARNVSKNKQSTLTEGLFGNEYFLFSSIEINLHAIIDMFRYMLTVKRNLKLSLSILELFLTERPKFWQIIAGLSLFVLFLKLKKNYGKNLRNILNFNTVCDHVSP